MKTKIPTLKIDELKEVLKEFFINPEEKQEAIPLIWSAPGIGKSQTIYDLAKEINADVIPFFASGADETEINGIPVPNEKKGVVEYMRLEHQNFSKDKPCIWFWDEINRARPEVIQALFSIISTYPRMIGTHEIPDNVYIVLCANEGSADGTIVTEFSDTSFFSKLAHIKVDFDKGNFLNYLKSRYVNAKGLTSKTKTSMKHLLGFLEVMNKEFFISLPENPAETKAFVTPRTIEKFFKTFGKTISEYKPNNMKSKRRLEFGASVIGLPFIADFSNYLDEVVEVEGKKKVNFNSILDIDDKDSKNDLSQIIENFIPKKAMKVGEEIKNWFVSTSYDSANKKINQHNFALILQVIQKVPKDTRTSIVSELLSKDTGNFVRIGAEMEKLDSSFEKILNKDILENFEEA